MVLGEVLLKITRSIADKNQNIDQSTLFQLSLQQLPVCFNQDSQEQIARQIVICRPLVSRGSFPPVQTDQQAASGYRQVGPVVPETGSLDRMSKTEQDAWESSAQHCGPAGHLRLISILFTHWSHLVASKRSISGEESKTEGSRGTTGKRVASHERGHKYSVHI